MTDQKKFDAVTECGAFMREEPVPSPMKSDIRYAQCWEDADTVLAALNIQHGFTCLSIASGGDNTLAMLSRGPRKVIAVDLNAAQLAVLELRVAAYRTLTHPELLAIHGSTESRKRQELYQLRGLKMDAILACTIQEDSVAPIMPCDFGLEELTLTARVCAGQYMNVSGFGEVADVMRELRFEDRYSSYDFIGREFLYHQEFTRIQPWPWSPLGLLVSEIYGVLFDGGREPLFQSPLLRELPRIPPLIA